jgi:fatty acid desaturase
LDGRDDSVQKWLFDFGLHVRKVRVDKRSQIVLQMGALLALYPLLFLRAQRHFPHCRRIMPAMQNPLSTVVIMVAVMTLAFSAPLALTFEFGLFGIVASGKICPGPGSGIRIAPIIVVVVIVITVLIVIWLGVQFHNYREGRRHDHARRLWRSHDAGAEQQGGQGNDH